jgi:hypothetical protein
MIRAPLRLFLSALLSLGLAGAVAAQQPTRPGASGAQGQGRSTTKPAAPAQTPAKPAASGQAKPAASNQRKPAAAAPAVPGGGQANLVQSYGDWGVYTTPAGRAKICYALSQPKSRAPSSLKEVPGYLFVATRPSENVRNEISLIMNFDLKESAEHQAVLGRDQFTLVAKGKNLWVKNPAEERRVIEAMKRASELTVKGTSAKNNATADKYSLKGFGDALDRVQKECR